MEGTDQGETAVSSYLCFQGCTVGALSSAIFPSRGSALVESWCDQCSRICRSHKWLGNAEASVWGPRFENHCIDWLSVKASVYSTGVGWCCFSFMDGTSSDPGKTRLELSQNLWQHPPYIPDSWQGACAQGLCCSHFLHLYWRIFFLFFFTATL